MKQLILIVIWGILGQLHVFGQNSDFPYKLNRNDVYISSAGIISCATGYLIIEAKKPLSINEIQNLNKQNINSFDRKATNKWSLNADRASDWFIGGLMVSVPITVTKFGKERQFPKLFILGTMYAENLALVLGLTQSTKNIVGRNRPFLYNAKLTSDDKIEAANGKNGRNSFYSMHTAMAFSSAMFLSKTYGDLYGKDYKYWILTSAAFGVATSIGFLRFEAGRHYPTDILTGAFVGTAIGYLIPKLHQFDNKNISFVVTPKFGMIALNF